MYDIAFDSAEQVLHLRLEGFWSRVTIAAFAAEMAARVQLLRMRYGKFAILSDSRSFPVQSPEVAQSFERMMARSATLHPGSTAIVVGSMLNKLQAERAMAGPRLRVFLDMEEARSWLADERAPRR